MEGASVVSEIVTQWNPPVLETVPEALTSSVLGPPAYVPLYRETLNALLPVFGSWFTM